MKNKMMSVFLSALVAGMLCTSMTAMAARPDAKWMVSDIAGSLTADTQVSLKDDYAAAVNKEWASTHSIPEGYTSISGLAEGLIETDQQKQNILENLDQLKGRDADLVRNAYAIISDWDVRNELGVSVLKEYIEPVRAAQNMEDLKAYLLDTDGANAFRQGFVKLYTDASLDNPENYTVWVYQSDTILKNAGEYRKQTTAGKMKKEYESRSAVYLLTRMGYSEQEAQSVFDRAFSFEQKLSEQMYTTEDEYQGDFYARIDNNYTREDFQKTFALKNYPLIETMEKQGWLASDTYLVTNPKYLLRLDELFTESNFEEIRDDLIIKILTEKLARLDREAYEYLKQLYQEIYGTDLTTRDEKYFRQLTDKMVEIPLDNLYIRKYASPETQKQIEEIIREIIAEYKIMIQEQDWLSEGAKAAAVNKLDHMQVNVCVPQIRPDTKLFGYTAKKDGGNLTFLEIDQERFKYQVYLSRINQRTSREWDQSIMTASTTNAFYMPSGNSINILNGILAGTVYNKSMSKEQILGGIGAVIGHEISHAFDITGAQFDEMGKLRNWWTDEDYTGFEKRNEKLVRYFNEIQPFQNEDKYPGEIIKGEASADQGGVKVTLRILKKMQNPDYDAYFRQYASSWRTLTTKENEIRQMFSNEHPLNYLRINTTLQQYPEFQEYYDIKPGDGMYLAPEDVVTIW